MGDYLRPINKQEGPPSVGQNQLLTDESPSQGEAQSSAGQPTAPAGDDQGGTVNQGDNGQGVSRPLSEPQGRSADVSVNTPLASVNIDLPSAQSAVFANLDQLRQQAYQRQQQIVRDNAQPPATNNSPQTFAPGEGNQPPVQFSPRGEGPLPPLRENLPPLPNGTPPGGREATPLPPQVETRVPGEGSRPPIPPLPPQAPNATPPSGREPGPLPPQSQGHGNAYGRAGREPQGFRTDGAVQSTNNSPVNNPATRNVLADTIETVSDPALNLLHRATTRLNAEIILNTERQTQANARNARSYDDNSDQGESGSVARRNSNRSNDRGSGNLERRTVQGFENTSRSVSNKVNHLLDEATPLPRIAVDKNGFPVDSNDFVANRHDGYAANANQTIAREHAPNFAPNSSPNQNIPPEQANAQAQGGLAFAPNRFASPSTLPPERAHINERISFRTDNSEALPREAISYLRGLSDGKSLPPDVRWMLGVVAGAVGLDRINQLLANKSAGFSDSVENIILQMILLAARGRGGGAEAQSGVPYQQPITQQSINQQVIIQRTINELVAIAKLEKFFEQMDKASGGSRTTNQAQSAVANFLLNGYERTVSSNADSSRNQVPVALAGAAELLRDLRGGLFRPTYESHNPFPLTGRARVVTEMMELMRTLDAVDRFMQKFEARLKTAHVKTESMPSETLFTSASTSTSKSAALKEGAPLNLPGRAGREEMFQFINQLGEKFLQGREWRAADGTPLKLGEALWLSTTGGLLGSSARDSDMLIGEQTSSLLLYGFDAIYPLIGFDGRMLNNQGFVAVQAQINDSEPQWVFGQEPLSPGWLRALIERLKDSFMPDYNSLGEMLEEALVEGRFYTAVVTGTVAEGAAVAGTFALTQPPVAGWRASSPPAYA